MQGNQNRYNVIKFTTKFKDKKIKPLLELPLEQGWRGLSTRMILGAMLSEAICPW